MAHDLSPWGMYQNADVVVKAVMIGLAIASIMTWTIWISKGFRAAGCQAPVARRNCQPEKARSLTEASATASTEGTLAHLLVHDALEEMRLSANSREREGIKERVSFRLERLVAACGRNMSMGTGVLATIGSTAPFVGLFGTVWGIMNSFIGIAKTQTTNLAVVAPGIAEALLATALARRGDPCGGDLQRLRPLHRRLQGSGLRCLGTRPAAGQPRSGSSARAVRAQSTTTAHGQGGLTRGPAS